MKRLTLILMVPLTLILAAVACTLGPNEATIEGAFMASDEDGEEQTTVFTQADTIYAFVDVTGAMEETVTEAVWKVELAQGVEPELEIERQTLEGGGRLIFSLFNDQPWPIGQYLVEIYLNEELTETLEFEVR